jgi:hypothetical protein
MNIFTIQGTPFIAGFIKVSTKTIFKKGLLPPRAATFPGRHGLLFFPFRPLAFFRH